MSGLSQTTKLPFGYTVTFLWSEEGGMFTEWEPDFPEFKSERATRRFIEAYKSARKVFVTDVATVMGGSILIVDDGIPTETICPARKH